MPPPLPTRRSFLAWLGTLPLGRGLPAPRGQDPLVDVRPTALFQAPDGRRNLVRIIVTGLDAPAARARVTDRRGALVATAGLVQLGDSVALSGEAWIPLSAPAEFQIDVEVGRDRAARRRVRLVPPKRWTVYWLASAHTDVGHTDLQERALEVHRRNLDAALRRLTTHPEYRFTAECAVQVLSYLEHRSEPQADALLQAFRDGRVAWHALFANMLTGLLDHDTFARLVWPAGRLARERGLAYTTAQIGDVPGQPATFPMLLAASGVKYLASATSSERAVPLEDALYPQLYYWEGPDGSRVLHWRALPLSLVGSPEDMGRRLSDWLLTNPVFLGRDWTYDVALLYGADARPNARIGAEVVANAIEFGRRFAFPRLVTARAEDFFRDVERRFGTRIPVRRGDTGVYREDGAASTAAPLAEFRAAQLTARAAEILALWDGRLEGEPADDAVARGRRRRAEERAAMWRDLLLFGEHTWGAQESVTAPGARQTVAQWAYKRRFIESGAAAAHADLAAGLLRLGRNTRPGRGRIVFNAGSWERTDVVEIAGGAGKTFSFDGRELPAVDTDGGHALVLVRDVPPLGYLALSETDRESRPPIAEGDAVEAKGGGITVQLDPGTGAIRSLVGSDGRERVKASEWSGLNQLVSVLGQTELVPTQARLISARRERLPGIGTRLLLDRALEGFSSLSTRVTLYDDLPWVDIENRIVKHATHGTEALYVAFPFAFTKPTVEIEVPLGRMTVERDQQPGSNRDWYCHTHWVWLHEGGDGGGVLWSGPDTPLLTLNDIVRGQWRRTIVPDGTLFAYAMNNYWRTNFAAGQDGPATFRFRLSLLGPGDAAEPVRRGWAACDPLRVSAGYDNPAPGPLIPRDRALFFADSGVMVAGAKRADDGAGVIIKWLDVAGQARAIGMWPAAYAFRAARRASLVEQQAEGESDTLPLAADGKTTVELSAWGLAAVRLFTPAEPAG